MPESVSEHAAKLISKLTAEGKITETPATSLTFSAGTAPLTDAENPPTAPTADAAPPAIAEGTVIEPTAEQIEGTSDAAIGGERPPSDAAAPTPPLPERGADGKFLPKEGTAAPTDAPAPAPTTGSPQARAAGEQAAEAAAAAHVEDAAPADDPWAEYEEVTYDDPDTNDRLVVRAPKTYAKRVAQGYVRRSRMHRAETFLGEARPALEPLIVSGQMRQVLPLIQRATQDQEFADFVIAAYNRRVSGQPLQAAAASPPPAAPTAIPTYTPGTPLPEDADALAAAWADPLVAEALRPVLAKVGTLETRLAEQQRAVAAEREASLAQQRANQARGEEMRAAHYDLAAAYPDTFTGDLTRDTAPWQRVIAYANNAGLVQTYGLRAGIVMAAAADRAMRAEASASPVADALARIDTQTREAARRQASAAARTVATGTPTAPPPPPPPARPPAVKRQDGARKSVREFADEVLAQQRAAG